MSRNGHFRLYGSLATAYAPNAERSSEGDILFGLREDDADIRLSGLREDDAMIRLGYNGELGVSAYDMEGLREDDAMIRLGDTKWDGSTGRAEGSAEGHRDAQLGISAYDIQPAILSSDGRIGGMVEDHWGIRMDGLREDDAGIRMGISAYDLEGLREDDANIRLSGLREDDAGIRLGTSYAPDAQGASEGNRSWGQLGVSAYDELGDVDSLSAEAAEIEQKQTLRGIRMGYILRGLREDDANIRLGVSAYDELGRRRAFGPRRHLERRRRMISGAEENPPEMLAAEGFHERFPVRVDISGLGVIHGTVDSSNLEGLFDFLKSKPSAEEYIGKIRLVLDGWRVVKPQLYELPEASRKAIIAQMTALNNGPDRYESMNGFLAEGYAGYTDGRYSRVKRLEAYLPTVQKMVSEARALGGNFTVEQANKVAAEDLKTRQESISQPTFLEKAAPIIGAAGAAGLLTALVLSIA
jgi:hypothetical protein